MLILVSGSTISVQKYADSGVLGRLYEPRGAHTPKDDLPWAADNGAFAGFNETRFLKMLVKLKGVEGCKFVACPDVVGNWTATRDLFEEWGPFVAADFPVAYVAQDGILTSYLPWSDCDAVFIGGSTEWKLSDDARLICEETKRRRKWLHMGRVNTLRRLKRCFDWRVDSIDGTAFSMYGDTYIPKFIQAVKNERRQGRFEFRNWVSERSK